MRFVIVLIFALGMCFFPVQVYAEEFEEQLLEDMELEEMQEIIDGLLQDESIPIKETIKDMLSGKIPFSITYFAEIMSDGVEHEWKKNQSVFGQVLLLALVSAVLTSFIQVFDRDKIGDLCFYIIYLMIFVLLLHYFGSLSENLGDTLQGIVSFMQALIPSYYIAVSAATGVTSAVMFHQIVLIVIFCVEYITAMILMPAVHIYVLLSFINLLTKEEMLSKISELVKNAVLWMQKTMLAVIVGMQVIQSMIAPAVDSLKRSVLGKSVSVIPGIGSAMNGVTELIFGSAVLIRNCFGATAMIVLVLLGIAPLIRLGLNTILYKFTGALLQPVCDSRLVGCFQSMGEGCGLLLKLLFTTQVLFMLTIVIIANLSGVR